MSCKPTYKGVRYNSLKELYNERINELEQKRRDLLLIQEISKRENFLINDKDIAYHSVFKNLSPKEFGYFINIIRKKKLSNIEKEIEYFDIVFGTDYTSMYRKALNIIKDKNSVFDTLEKNKEYSLSDFAEKLEPKSKYLKQLLKAVSDVLDNLGYKVIITDDMISKTSVKDAIGVTKWIEGKIYLGAKVIKHSYISSKLNSEKRGSTDNFNNYITYVFLHEFFHSFTSPFINIEKNYLIDSEIRSKYVEFNTKLKDIYDYASKNKILFKEYGVSNISEFIAEMANEEFVNKLKSIELPKHLRTNSKVKNIFDTIVDLIRNLLNLKIKKYNAADEMYKLLADYLTTSNKKDYTEIQNFYKVYNTFIEDIKKESKTENPLVSNKINYTLKAIEVLQSDKAKRIFEKGEKEGLSLKKILNELEKPEKKQSNINKEEQAIRQELNKINKELSEEYKKKTEEEFVKSIFPNTKVKQIVYHLTSNKFNKFEEKYIKRGRFGHGFYFSATTEFTKRLFTDDEGNFPKNVNKIQAVINLKNPLTDVPSLRQEVEDKVKSENRDGVIVGAGKFAEFTVNNSNQIHIITEQEQNSIRNNQKIEQLKQRQKELKNKLENIKSHKQAEQDLKNENISNFTDDIQIVNQNTIIPKAQKELILEKGLNSREEIIASLLADNSFTVEINLSEYEPDERYIDLGDGDFDIIPNEPEFEEDVELIEDEFGNITPKISRKLIKDTEKLPTEYYKGLSARQKDNSDIKYNSEDWSYQELEIRTPDITPSIKGHADFSTKEGIGWFRVWTNNKTGEIEVQEIQSDLFQKGKTNGRALSWNRYLLDENEDVIGKNPKFKKEQDFLNLLLKKSTWVNFFIQSIVQDSAKKGFEIIRFPLGETAAKIEGHDLIDDRIKKINEDINNIEKAIKNPLEFKDKTQPQFVFKYKTLGRNSITSFISDEENINTYDFIYKLKETKKDLEEEKKELKTQGLEKLAPIEHFYENVVSKKVKKLYKNVKEVTDKEGNKWLEVDISKEENKSKNILFQKIDNKIAGQANIKALSILLDAKYIDDTTIPHEYAHFYIDWNKNTEIVKEALNKWATEGKELNYDKQGNIIEDENYVEAVENLVQAVAEQVVKQEGEALSWWKKFLKWLGLELNKIKELNKEELKNILTDAFLNNEDLQSLNERLLEENLKSKTSDLLLPEDIQKINSELTEIQGLNTEQLNEVIDYLVNGIVLNSDSQAVINDFINELKNINSEEANIVLNNIEKIAEYVNTEIRKINENSLIKIYGKDNFEYNTQSLTLKKLYFGIENKDKNGNDILNFLGLKTYIPFNVIDAKIKDILTYPNETFNDFNTVISKLEEEMDNYVWMEQFLIRLKQADSYLKNLFLTENDRHNLIMDFIMNVKDKKRGETLQIYFTNSNEIETLLKNDWNNNIKNSDLLIFDNDKMYIDTEYYKSFLNNIRNLLHLEEVEITSKNVKRVINEIIDNLIDDEWKDLIKIKDKIDKSNISKQKKILWAKYFKLKQKILKRQKEKFDILREILNLNNETSNNKVFTVEDKTISYIMEKGIFYNNKYLEFSQLFNFSNKPISIFGYIFNEAMQYIKSGKDFIEINENKTNYPFQKASMYINQLAKIDKKFSNKNTMISFRDGDKQIFSKPLPKHSTSTANELATSGKQRRMFLKVPFNKESLWLKILDFDSKFRNLFKISHVGITSLKIKNKKVKNSRKIVNSNEKEFTIIARGYMQDVRQENINYSDENGFSDFRIGKLLFPTLSDKSQMLTIKTILFDIDKKHLSPDLEMITDKRLLDILYKQIVQPEVNRIKDFYKRGGKTNIKNYDVFAKIFNILPEINNIKYKDVNIPSLFAEGKVNNEIEEYFYNESIKIIQNYFKKEVNKTVNKWKDYFITDGQLEFFDKLYIKKLNEDNINKILTISAYDYIVNSFVGYTNILMLFTGDIAQFGKAKQINELFNNGDILSPKFNTSYKNFVINSIDTNFGKRLTLLLASKKRQANSYNSEYIQVFLKDFVTTADNLKNFTLLHDGIIISDEEIKTIKDYINGTLQDITKYDELKKKFKNSSAFFELESTDSQEYETAYEYFISKFEEGKLTDDEFYEIITKIQAQRNKEVLDEEDFINNSKVIAQINKPVAAGLQFDKDNNVLRTVYIKSGSFPLLRELTQGTELDKLRKYLEEIEDRQHKRIIKLSNNRTVTVPAKTVRASYNSGNKVGAIKNPVSLFKNDNTFNDNLVIEDFINSSLTLRRYNFGFQQENPVKFNKKEENRIKLGTQISKSLFYSLLHIKDFKYVSDILGKTITSGEELYKYYVDIFNNILEINKENILNKFGLDKNFDFKSKYDYVKKLYRVLKEEAIARNHNYFDINGLKMNVEADIYVNDSLKNSGNFDIENLMFLDDFVNGKIEFTEKNLNKFIKLANITDESKVELKFEVKDFNFKIPLWLLSNSEKYESLLNSIVNKYLVNLEVPGFSLYIVSEAGFKINNKIENSQIVYTKYFDKKYGKLKAAKFDEKGNLISKAQIFIPFRYKDSRGEYIEFFYSDGKPNTKYVYKDVDGRYYLKNNIPDELLHHVSYRIPYASHELGGEFEIAGFLPYISGDMIVLPDTMTIQKGIDNDGDKENLQSLNTYMFYDGSLEVINPKNTERILKEGKMSFYDIKKKMYENELMNIFSAVFSSVNPEVQRKITKSLSIKFAKEQKEMFDSSQFKDIDSIFSINHQFDKMNKANIGNIAIGIYSNNIILHSSMNLLKEDIDLVLDDSHKDYNYLIFGDFDLKNDISSSETLRPYSISEKKWNEIKRNKAEVFSEKQNTATDNENEQILGSVGINDKTITVEIIMTHLGIDKDVIEDINGDRRIVHVPYLFVSQPIIKEYIKEVKYSITDKFEHDKKNKIIQNLIKKYGGKTDFIDFSDLISQTLYDNIFKEVNNDIQVKVLKYYLFLEEYGSSLANFSSKFNITSEGLGKSFFNVIEILNFLTKEKTERFSNLNKLIGDFKIAFDKEDEDLYKKEGYTKFDNIYIKPETIIGNIFVSSIDTAYNLYKDLFPYNSGIFNSILNNLRNYVDINIETKKTIFENFKRFLFSSTALKLWSVHPQKVRKRLLIDNENKISLATYLQKYVMNIDVLKNNPLLINFTYDIDKDSYSIIKFNASNTYNLSEKYYYNSIMKLYNKNKKLPDFNGESYSTHKLADDLIRYSFITGGVQKAIEFIKFIPVSLLNSTDMTIAMKEWNKRLIDINKDVKTSYGLNLQTLSLNFIQQFLQHYPELLESVNTKFKYKKDFVVKSKNSVYNKDKLLLEFEFESDSRYLSIYSFKEKKYLLFKKEGNKYVRLDNLGVFGVFEYSILDILAKSLVNNVNNRISNYIAPSTSNEIPYDILNSDTTQILQNIINDKNLDDFYVNIAKVLLTSLNNNSIKYVIDSYDYNGIYDRKTNTIHIDESLLNDRKNLAKTLLKELVHANTVGVIEKYIDRNGNLKQENVPSYVRELKLIFETFKKHISETYGENSIKKVKDKINNHESLSSEELLYIYPSTNIFEFIEVMFTEEETQKFANEIKYLKSNSNILEKFFNILKNLLTSLSQNKLTYNAINNIVNIISENETVKKEETSLSENVTIIEDELSELGFSENIFENLNNKQSFIDDPKC